MSTHSIPLVFILLSFTFACKQEEKKVEPLYYYYPEKNVYFDPAKQTFWYSLNGAKSWNSFSGKVDSTSPSLGERVSIYSSATEIYKDNENHRKMYAGRLYLFNTDSFNSNATEVTERKVATRKKPVAVKKPAAVRTKNSIGKFIDKLFKK